MKTEWIKGIPTDPGVYWFDTGTGLGPKPLVLKIFSEGIPYFYGDGEFLFLQPLAFSFKKYILPQSPRDGLGVYHEDIRR